ncbi:thioesterase II family protein [Streptomyces iconiensis]|uniref:Alpha/beta fold hydrolase n=1 Tax=Streptomyces iconiensis TaxID=1384038 RepID=A0ABT6ZVD7_9ACTN|nr:alpha/beta fold hydrolase [Streptomyces iconiensis]MDJ1133035.1 alpha/beta fold hydrolase [Streptomyces iconiensis]
MSTVTSAASSSAWLPFPPREGARLRLFCFPCAGQGASVYRPWQRLLAPDIDVVPVQLPGREGRATEAPYRAMDRLMDGLLPVLRKQIRGPYALFGHSLGAMVAFETARRLEAEGRSPLRLTVAAQRPPHVPGERAPLHDLPYAAFMTMLGLYGQVPVELFDDRAALDLAASSLRADFALVETYVPPGEPPLACPVTVLAGLADSSIPPASLRGWKALTEGEFTFRPVPGGHFFVNERTEEITGLLRAAHS